MKKTDVVRLLQRETEKAGSRRKWATAAGLSSVYVDDVIKGTREPGGKILAALGVERVVTYRRIKRDG